jgi:hypothetical protein
VLKSAAAMKKLVFLLACFLTAAAQNTDHLDVENSGNEYLSGCAGITDSDVKSGSAFIQGLCFGYLTGFLDGYEGGARVYASKGKNVTFCLPPEGTRGQNVRVFMKYLSDHPENLHESTGSLIIRAIHAAFPCK